MSATRRGAKLDRSGRDFYPTPPHAVRSLLPLLAETMPDGGLIAEPCAGDRAICTVLEREGRYRTIAGDIAVDPPQQSLMAAPSPLLDGVAYCDATDPVSLYELTPDPDAIVTNPPYSLADEIAPALVAAWPGRPVWLLLRLNWLEPSRKRTRFLREYTPRIAVLARRPSFRASGTDACAYAWFGFSAGPPTVRIV